MATDDGKILARWVGGFEAHLIDGTVLVPGETEVRVSAFEADESANWEPLEPIPTPPSELPLDQLKKAQLVERATELGLDTEGTVAELVARIEEHLGEGD